MSVSNKSDSWSDEKNPGLWHLPINDKLCCIYRVPNQLRRVNPEAYTPQMLLIGPLHYSKKSYETDSRYVDYINIERYKKDYVKKFANTYGTETVEEFRKIIKGHEKLIRESYAESTDWIKSVEFVEMILHDSVFIFRVVTQPRDSYISKDRDILFDQPCLFNIIEEDLLLLENQLPFFILRELFEPFFKKFFPSQTFLGSVLVFFKFGRIKREILHFTDLLRHVRVMTLDLREEEIYKEVNRKSLETSIISMKNADMLNCAGVEFARLKDYSGISLATEFKGRTLTMPRFIADDKTEKMWRNLMALEQSHYPFSAYVCSYIRFLNVLIATEQDVDLLVKNEVIKHCLESSQGLKKMVDKLCEGTVIIDRNYYHKVAKVLNSHYYHNGLATIRVNLSIAKLRRVYFNDLWTGTATVSAVVLLVLTLMGTVASVLQAMQGPNNSSNKSPLPPPSTRGL